MFEKESYECCFGRLEIICCRHRIHDGISRKGMKLTQWKLIGLHPTDMKAE